MKKYLIAIFLFSTIAIAQITEEHLLVKNTLVDMTIRWNQSVKALEQLNNLTNELIIELQAIENPSDELKTIMVKYQIYKEPEIPVVEEPE